MGDKHIGSRMVSSWFILSLLLAGCCAADRGTAGSVPAVESRYRKCISAPFISGGVTVDGVLNEKVWEKAAVFCDFQNPKTGKPAASRTEARIFHDEKYLYLGLKCFDKRSALTVIDAHGSSPWGGDHVELFIGGLEPEPNSLQFVWGPGKAVFGSGPHWETKSRIEDDYWTSETRIELSALTLNNSVTGMHLVREVKKNQAVCQFCDVGGDYQSIQNYAELILGSYAQAVRLKFHRDCPETLSREEYEKINAQLTVPRHRIIRGPWLFDASEDRMSIGWYTAGRTGSLLQYRKKGTIKFNHILSGYTDSRWDKDRRLHKVQLTGLKPGEEYEYRIQNMNLNDKDFVEYPTNGDCYTFSVHGKKDLSFLLFVDVHGDGGAWAPLIRSPFAENCDLIVNIGDMLSNGTGIPSIFNGYFDAQLPFAVRKPVLNFRGNHEYVGTSPGTFDAVFASPGWKGYSLHRFGDVCLIGLDAFNGTQKEWLKKAVKTPEFLTAKHRIVVTHYPVFSENPHSLKNIDGIFIGKDRSASIDLYLCGHVHRGAFAKKNTGKLEWLDNGETRKEKKLPFDMIINEGPNTANENTAMLVEAKGDHLTVKLLKRDGSVYRSFKIK